MKKYLDPLFFLFLLGIDLVVWLLAWLLFSVPALVVILAPALASLAALGLIRVAAQMDPRKFWAQITAVTAIYAVFLALAQFITPDFKTIDVGFNTSITFLVAAMIGSALALFLALFGAIPVPLKAEVENLAGEAEQEVVDAVREAREAALETGAAADAALTEAGAVEVIDGPTPINPSSN